MCPSVQFRNVYYKVVIAEMYARSVVHAARMRGIPSSSGEFNLLKMASLLDRDLGAHLQEGDESLLHSLLLEVVGLKLSCMSRRSWLPLKSLL